MKKLFTLMVSAIISMAAMAQQTETYAEKLTMSVGGMWNYETEDNVSYTITSYEDNGTEKMDICVPAYTLKETAIGDINVGSYIIKGLEYNTEKGGFYRNYANDGLTLEFSSSSIKAGTYELSAGDNGTNIQDILVRKNVEDNTVSITNQFKVGRMPFQLTSEFTGKNVTSTGISLMKDAKAQDAAVYDLSGKTAGKISKGKIYVVNGQKVMCR